MSVIVRDDGFHADDWYDGWREAAGKFGTLAKEAVERTVKELEEMRRQAASSIVIPKGGLPPVDLYVPRTEVSADDAGRATITLGPAEAYEAWHRPLKRVDHG